MGRTNGQAGRPKSSNWKATTIHSLLLSCQTHKGRETPGVLLKAYHHHDDDDNDDDDVVQVYHEGPTKSHWTHHVFPEVVFFELSHLQNLFLI